jgi:hypothetical protein
MFVPISPFGQLAIKFLQRPRPLLFIHCKLQKRSTVKGRNLTTLRVFLVLLYKFPLKLNLKLQTDLSVQLQPMLKQTR